MSDLRLTPMTSEQYATYVEQSSKSYAADLAQAGAVSPEKALEVAAEQFRKTLPEGLETPDQFLFTAYAGDVEVGLIWVQARAGEDQTKGWIFDIAVKPEERRHGYGRQMMLAIEDFCRDKGATEIGLNVFGYNTGARALYEEIGYQIVGIHMNKGL